MAGLMDFVLALVRVLCGSSTVREEPQATEYQKPLPEQRRPATQPQCVERYRQEQAWKPSTFQPVSSLPEHRPHQVYQKPPPDLPDQQRPATQSQWVEHYRQEQAWKPSTSQPVPSCPEHRPHQDQDQGNQHDKQYTALRAKAIEHGDLMARCFQDSHEAYDRGDHARAKALSAEGKQHERTMESLNAEASAWIFRQNNLDSKAGEIDLHGLYVKEAVSYAEKSIEAAQRRGDTEIRLIVGKGLHSNGRVAKIKPAIEDLMKKRNIPTEIDPLNGGVLVARLS